MAGRGPAPTGHAVRRNAPARGEWTDIPQRNAKRAPAMPSKPREGWAAGTKLAWKAWWEDGASVAWGPADVEAVRQLAYLHHDVEMMADTRGKSSLLGELRQRMDGLGLTLRGKRDLRLRVTVDELGEKRVESTSRYSHLKVVADAVEGS
jgi:hypothetical protein